MIEDDPLPFGPWWSAYQRLVVGDDELPMVPVALAFSHILQGGYPWLGAEAQLHELEQEAVRRTLGRPPSPAARAIVGLLAEQGFLGDSETYEDPANSLLDRVLERRRGLPITLSLLVIHLGQHARVPLQGIGFPGHFLVGMGLDQEDPLVFDPFRGGQELDGQDLADLLLRATGRPGDWRSFLRPAPPRRILERMLRNLIAHLRRARLPHHAETAERLLEMTEAPEARMPRHPPD
ncbi:MAG: hypothetical protein H6712_12805 [Myxococcales bacterium]|nr:hypothetical protein [Myxococcales bacterium]